jgi:cytochrome c-type biogenesis protein CcmE
MAQQLGWEKTSIKPTARVAGSVDRLKFIAVGVVLVAVIGFLLISGTAANGRYFITVNSLLTRPELSGKVVKISGAVIGSTIKNDPNTRTIQFTLANLTDDLKELEVEGGLAKALHTAVTDPNAQTVKIVIKNQPLPDLLQNEAQAILTGRLDSDGVFYADEILLKCPSKYQSEVPKQT